MIFQKLSDIVVDGIAKGLGGMWCPMAEETVNVMYELAEHPDVIAGTLINNLVVKVLGSPPPSEDDGSEKGKENVRENTVTCIDTGRHCC